MADTETPDDAAKPPEALAIDPEDPRHLDAAQYRVENLMKNAADHGAQKFFTGHGVVTFQPLSDEERARAAVQVRRWAEGAQAPHPDDLYREGDDHPHVRDLHAAAAKQLPDVKGFYTNIADALDGSVQDAGAIEHVAPFDSDASKLPQFVHDWWKGLGEDMRQKAAEPQSELWRDFAVKALTMAPLAVRASPGAIAAAEARAVPAPKELGPWDEGFDQGAWRDAHPTKAELGDLVKAYRAEQSRPITRPPEEPMVSWQKFKDVMSTPKGYALATTILGQPFIATMMRHSAAKPQLDFDKLADQEEALITKREADPTHFTEAGYDVALKQIQDEMRTLSKDKGVTYRDERQTELGALLPWDKPTKRAKPKKGGTPILEDR